MTSKSTRAKKKALGGIKGTELIRLGLLDEADFFGDWQDMAELRKKTIRDGHLAFLKKHKMM